MLDYEDYLRVRGLELWDKDSERAVKTRKVCAARNDSEFFREAVMVRPDVTVANIAIILLHQVDVLLHRLIERQKRDFLREGGIREQMSRARREARKWQSPQNPQSPQSPQSSPSSPSSQSFEEE